MPDNRFVTKICYLTSKNRLYNNITLHDSCRFDKLPKAIEFSELFQEVEPQHYYHHWIHRYMEVWDAYVAMPAKFDGHLIKHDIYNNATHGILSVEFVANGPDFFMFLIIRGRMLDHVVVRN